MTREDLVANLRNLFDGLFEEVVATLDDFNTARVRSLVASLTGNADGPATTKAKRKADALQGALHLDVRPGPRGDRRKGRRAEGARVDEGEPKRADPARARAARRDDDADTTPRGRKPNSCKKCGAVGFTSATCGKTHNVTAAASPAPNSSTVSPPPSRADRFARIEAAARARNGASQ